MKLLSLICSIACCSFTFATPLVSKTSAIDTPLVIRQCKDFIVTGKGDNPEWQKAIWVPLNQIDKTGKQHETKIKILYSATGIYVLYSGEDEKITSSFQNDFDDLYKGDVFEVFFHPDPSTPVYFEYEVSPLNKELVLLISNQKGNFGRWMPWHYEDYKVVKKVNLSGGEMKSGSNIKAWSAEIFFPFSLLNLLEKVPPKSGMRWNANFCRLDYDSGKMIKWSWSPIKASFHEFQKYYAVQFE